MVAAAELAGGLLERLRERTQPIKPIGELPDICGWAEEKFYVVETGRPIQLLPHQKEILKIFTAQRADGAFQWQTLMFSTIKKSGQHALGRIPTYTETIPAPENAVIRIFERPISETYWTRFHFEMHAYLPIVREIDFTFCVRGVTGTDMNLHGYLAPEYKDNPFSASAKPMAHSRLDIETINAFSAVIRMTEYALEEMLAALDKQNAIAQALLDMDEAHEEALQMEAARRWETHQKFIKQVIKDTKAALTPALPQSYQCTLLAEAIKNHYLFENPRWLDFPTNKNAFWEMVNGVKLLVASHSEAEIVLEPSESLKAILPPLPQS